MPTELSGPIGDRKGRCDCIEKLNSRGWVVLQVAIWASEEQFVTGKYSTSYEGQTRSETYISVNGVTSAATLVTPHRVSYCRRSVLNTTLDRKRPTTYFR